MTTSHAHITIVLDRSGSMNVIARETIAGFNRFVSEQNQPGTNARLTLIQFNGEIETVFSDVPIPDVAPLDEKEYRPDGSTALLDAIGHAIEKQSRAPSGEENSGQTIIVIFTDGEENASRKYTREEILALIRERREKQHWRFLFLGANQDAIKEAGTIGIAPESSLTFAHTGKGTELAFTSVSNVVNEWRTDEASGTFSKDDRKSQERLFNDRHKQRPSKN